MGFFMFWCDQLVEKIEGQQTINDSKTPSGRAHVGADEGLLDRRQQGIEIRECLLGILGEGVVVAVRDDIGRRIGITGGLIEIAAPRTPERPRSIVGSVAEKKTRCPTRVRC